MLQKNLLQAIGVVPFYIIFIYSGVYVLDVWTGEYASFENFIVIKELVRMAFIVLVPYATFAIYQAIRKQFFDLSLKLLYKLLMGTVLVFVVPTALFANLNTHIVCKGEAGCQEELEGWQRTHKERINKQEKHQSSALEGRTLPVESKLSENNVSNNLYLGAERQTITLEQSLIQDHFAADIRSSASDGDWNRFVNLTMQLSEHGPILLILPLFTAFEFNAPIEVIDKLLAMGIPLKVNFRVPAIMHDGGAEKLALLVERGLPLHGLDISGNNPLHTATSVALNSSVQHTNDVVEFILDNNIDPNELDQDGRSPLFYMLEIAYEEGYDDTIAELIRHGAAVNEQEILALNQLQEIFPERYEALLRKVPELVTD